MPPTGLNRYRILEKIGQGGTGKVFRAYDAILDRHVALKIITRRPNDDEVVERFRREALAAAQLTHPNVVTVYESGDENGEYFTAMELLKGVDIRALIRAKVRRDRVSRSRLRTLVKQLYDGAPGPAVLQLVRTGRLTPQEIRELQELIDQLDARGRSPTAKRL